MDVTDTALLSTPPARSASPFDLDLHLDPHLDDSGCYRRWRAWKLAHQLASTEALIVDIADPRALQPGERAALLDRITHASFAFYRSPVVAADKDIPRLLGAQLGLHRLDANWLADEDGISSIAISSVTDGRGGFIPYTDRAIRWHTDGYYHPAGRRIRGMILHCVRPAASGGVNGLLDHEMAYLRLRDISPAHVRALMQPDAMTIPARASSDNDSDGIARPAQSGPVFAVEADGSLHMRYTARTRSIEWKDDDATRAAVAALEGVLAADAPGVFHLRLQAGMGIVGHNVLHDRTGFEDDPALPRLLYRARFLDRACVPPEASWRNG